MNTRTTLLVYVTALLTVLNIMIYLSSIESDIVEIEDTPVRMHHAIYIYDVVEVKNESITV